MKIKVQIGFSSNGGSMDVHVKHNLFKKQSYYLYIPFSDSEWQEMAKMSKELGDIAYGISELDGVVSIIITPYCLSVRKSPVFEWDEIQNDVMYIVESVLIKDLDDILVINKAQA